MENTLREWQDRCLCYEEKYELLLDEYEKVLNELNELKQKENIPINNILDPQTELLKLFAEECLKSDKVKYSEIKKDLNLDAFMKATDNNLDMLFVYLYASQHYNFGLSDCFIIRFIKDEYDINYERKV